jgi:hypothetical protein
MEIRSKDRKPSIKTNSIQEEIHDNKHIKFSEHVVVESHKEPIHYDQTHHKFKEAETHYQDIDDNKDKYLHALHEVKKVKISDGEYYILI